MRDVPLTVIKGGINRLRTKGGARADTLYDLVNGDVTADNSVHCRPGSFREHRLDSQTKGLCSFDGRFHTFSAEDGDVEDGIELHIIVHPDATPDVPIQLSRIHFVSPYLGFLYIVAEFVGGDVFHYWLQSSGTWTASTPYKNGEVIEPTVPTGLGYQATRLGSPFPSWAPNVPRTVGDIVEPTVYNNFFFEVVDTIGATPRSGTVEPDWPTEDGAQVIEDVNGVSTSTATSTSPSDPSIPPSVEDRYG